MPLPEGPLPPPPGSGDNEANVAGRMVAPPSAGFGQLWRKELSLTLDPGPGAVELAGYWKQHLHELWPRAGALYRPHPGISEGDLLGIDLGVGPVKLSTGVVVIEANDTAFTLLSPEGHMFAGWNRFSTSDAPEGTRAAVTIEMRASDPLYELGLALGGQRAEERFWAEMLWNLAEHFGQRPKVHLTRRRLDKGRQWKEAGNVWRNALIRTMVRRTGRLFGVGNA